MAFETVEIVLIGLDERQVVYVRHCLGESWMADATEHNVQVLTSKAHIAPGACFGSFQFGTSFARVTHVLG